MRVKMTRQYLTTHDGFQFYKFLEGHVYDVRDSCAFRLISVGCGQRTEEDITSDGWEFEKILPQGYRELTNKISVFTHHELVTVFLNKGLSRLGYLQAPYDDLANTFNFPRCGKEWHLLLVRDGAQTFVTLTQLHKDRQIEDENLWVVSGTDAKALQWLSDLHFKIPTMNEVLCG